MAEKAKHDSASDKRGFKQGKTEQKKATPKAADRGRERQETADKKKKVR